MILYKGVLKIWLLLKTEHFYSWCIKRVLLIILRATILQNSSWWQLLNVKWFLFFFWNLGYLSLDTVVLHFLKNSSWVFFKVFKFLQFRIICFLETPLNDCFCPVTTVFCKAHSNVIDFHNSDLFKLLACAAVINVPELLFQ